MKLNYPLSALHALASTIVWARRSPNYATLQKRAQLEYNHLERQLKEQGIIKEKPPHEGETKSEGENV